MLFDALYSSNIFIWLHHLYRYVGWSLLCILLFIHNEYHFNLKTTVQITLIIRTAISCNCLSVDTSGDFISYILSHLRYEHWFQLVYVNTKCFSIQTKLLIDMVCIFYHCSVLPEGDMLSS